MVEAGVRNPSDITLKKLALHSLAERQELTPFFGPFSHYVLIISRLMASIKPVELLRRQYLQNLDPKSLTLPEKHVLKQPDVQKQIYACMFDKSGLRYPPPERYQFRILKRIITALEDAIEDPNEDVCNMFIASLTMSAFAAQADRISFLSGNI